MRTFCRRVPLLLLALFPFALRADDAQVVTGTYYDRMSMIVSSCSDPAIQSIQPQATSETIEATATRDAEARCEAKVKRISDWQVIRNCRVDLRPLVDVSVQARFQCLPPVLHADLTGAALSTMEPALAGLKATTTATGTAKDASIVCDKGLLEVKEGNVLVGYHDHWVCTIRAQNDGAAVPIVLEDIADYDDLTAQENWIQNQGASRLTDAIPVWDPHPLEAADGSLRRKVAEIHLRWTATGTVSGVVDGRIRE